jgi:hypothetical protein
MSGTNHTALSEAILKGQNVTSALENANEYVIGNEKKWKKAK